MFKNRFLAAIFSAALIFSSCKENKRESTDKIIPVKVTEVVATQTVDRRSYVGTVEESAAISLSFSMPGTVEEVFASEGQRVQKGQLLATLNVATAENSYQGALAKLRQAQDAYDRLTKVHSNGSLPDIKLVEVETGLQQATSQVAIAKKNMADCMLHAPRSGVIAARQVESGMNVMPSMQAFKLVTVETVLVKIPVPENEIGSIAVGQAANVAVAALNNAVFTGKVEMKGVEASAVTHTYDAKISINNPQRQLMPGMICRVTTFSATDGNAEFVVPNRCVQISSDGKKYVWLADGNVAKRQFVKTGRLTDEGIVIVEGLSAGNQLITEGFLKISEGTRVVNN
ncbi:MAG: efflux RND transporter periplasmic adaptor subunit [Prevotellaceae bacterium]|jgi:RND family efflux transporter MFP subunit|nr:efflux RND transporter periplasmic adaptor subunit [Prevotellaceae bacterium]